MVPHSIPLALRSIRSNVINLPLPTKMQLISCSIHNILPTITLLILCVTLSTWDTTIQMILK